VANYTSDLSSAQAALGNAINGTLVAVENAGSALTEAIVNAKLGLHNVCYQLEGCQIFSQCIIPKREKMY
jgi:hypothetical protein